MSLQRQHGRLHQRQIKTLGNRNIFRTRQFQNSQRIDRGLFHRAIAVHADNAIQLKFGRCDGQQNRQRVVTGGAFTQASVPSLHVPLLQASAAAEQLRAGPVQAPALHLSSVVQKTVSQ